MTPLSLARQVVADIPLTATSRVLEPSFGEGSFLVALVERLLDLHDGPLEQRLTQVFTRNLWGVEVDADLYDGTLGTLASRFGPLPGDHNLQRGDFFSAEFMAGMFDVVVGNPPYGGTFDPALEDDLDRMYGRWNGLKLKKETYSFFTARSLDWLAEQGRLVFIISDTMLTISTMAGLRARLMDTTVPAVDELSVFSDETTQPTLVLTAIKQAGGSELVVRNGQPLERTLVEATGNLSWNIDSDLVKYFGGPTVGEYIVCTGGMTIGNNDMFVREIVGDGLVEPFAFEFFDEPITLTREIDRARLNRISPRKEDEIRALEARGATRRNVRALPLDVPRLIELPHPDYRYYNKADSNIVYAPPRWAVFWKDDGDAVLTFKKNGNWYLHGVGGKGYFEREGLTWHLISNRLRMRYLPSGYILDSGAPCGFLRDGVVEEELWFVLGWGLTSLASRILKSVINHTRNIQGKDVERLPYPWWVGPAEKARAIEAVEKLVAEARSGRSFAFDDSEIQEVDRYYAWPDD